MSDLISRQAAIVALANNRCGNDEWDLAVTHDVETIKKIPSVDPEKCSDYISRQAVIETIETDCSWDMFDEWGNLTPVGESIIEAIKRVPSVEPERKPGKWIDVPQYRGILFECDFCHKYQGTIKYKYCHNCGAKMEVEE